MTTTATDAIRRLRDHPRATDALDALRGTIVMTTAIAVAIVMRQA
jgi:hypothetical protein